VIEFESRRDERVKRWDLEEDLELVTQVFYIRGGERKVWKSVWLVRYRSWEIRMFF
jgi:hypothetical protein